MAKLISKTISTSRKFNALPTWFSKCLYLLLVTHADDWGIVEGSAQEIKWRIFPASDVTPEEISKGLEILQDVRAEGSTGLIYRYIWRGYQLIEIVQFDRFQRIDRRKSPEFPRISRLLSAGHTMPEAIQLMQTEIDVRGRPLTEIDVRGRLNYNYNYNSYNSYLQDNDNYRESSLCQSSSSSSNIEKGKNLEFTKVYEKYRDKIFEELIPQYGLETVQQYISWITYQYRNPPPQRPYRLLVSLLKKGMDRPEGYVIEQQREEKIRRDREKAEAEKRRLEEEKQKAAENWEALSEAEREQYREKIRAESKISLPSNLVEVQAMNLTLGRRSNGKNSD